MMEALFRASFHLMDQLCDIKLTNLYTNVCLKFLKMIYFKSLTLMQTCESTRSSTYARLKSNFSHFGIVGSSGAQDWLESRH
jgi:hypothetical protein